MRKILLVFGLLFYFIISYGQNPLPLHKTDLNIGVGFSDWGLPFYIGIDNSITKDFTLGGEFSYRGYDDNINDQSFHHSITGFSGNGNYHFNSLLKIPLNWDFYAGFNLGFFIWTSPVDYPGTHSSGLGLGFQIGGRYYITDRFGLNLEFGGGSAFSNGKFGITIKL